MGQRKGQYWPVGTLRRVWDRFEGTVRTEPVDRVIFSVALFAFGLLLLVVGATDAVDGLRDDARGVHGTGVVQSCNDLRVARCDIRIVEPSNLTRAASVEPGSHLKPGTRLPLVSFLMVMWRCPVRRHGPGAGARSSLVCSWRCWVDGGCGAGLARQAISRAQLSRGQGTTCGRTARLRVSWGAPPPYPRKRLDVSDRQTSAYLGRVPELDGHPPLR